MEFRDALVSNANGSTKVSETSAGFIHKRRLKNVFVLLCAANKSYCIVLVLFKFLCKFLIQHRSKYIFSFNSLMRKTSEYSFSFPVVCQAFFVSILRIVRLHTNLVYVERRTS